MNFILVHMVEFGMAIIIVGCVLASLAGENMRKFMLSLFGVLWLVVSLTLIISSTILELDVHRANEDTVVASVPLKTLQGKVDINTCGTCESCVNVAK